MAQPAKPNPKRKRRRLRKQLRPIRHWVVAQFVRLMVWITLRLSHKSALSLGATLGRLGYFIARAERAKTLRNLGFALGEQLSEEKREEIAREVFQMMGMAAMEAILSTRWSADDLREIITIEGVENLSAHRAAGRGAVYVTGHFGSWELMTRVVTQLIGIPVGIIMRENQNPYLNEFISKIRAGEGTPVYSTEDSALRYVRDLRRGKVIGMLADQDSKHLRSVPVNYFGKPAMTPVGPAFLARLARLEIIPIFMHRRDDDPSQHIFHIYAPIAPDPNLGEEEDITRMLQKLSDIQENEVRAHLSQWVWMHERWKRGSKASRKKS